MLIQKLERELGLKIFKYEPGIATLVYENEEKDIPELNDYNPMKGTFDLWRYAAYKTDYSRSFVSRLVMKNQGGCIYNTITHYPPKDLSASKILLDGEPFVDLFGLHVYIFSTLSWTYRNDVDLRFEKGLYPYNIIEPELKFLLM